MSDGVHLPAAELQVLFRAKIPGSALRVWLALRQVAAVGETVGASTFTLRQETGLTRASVHEGLCQLELAGFLVYAGAGVRNATLVMLQLPDLDGGGGAPMRPSGSPDGQSPPSGGPDGRPSGDPDGGGGAASAQEAPEAINPGPGLVRNDRPDLRTVARPFPSDVLEVLPLYISALSSSRARDPRSEGLRPLSARRLRRLAHPLRLPLRSRASGVDVRQEELGFPVAVQADLTLQAPQEALERGTSGAWLQAHEAALRPAQAIGGGEGARAEARPARRVDQADEVGGLGFPQPPAISIRQTGPKPAFGREVADGGLGVGDLVHPATAARRSARAAILALRAAPAVQAPMPVARAQAGHVPVIVPAAATSAAPKPARLLEPANAPTPAANKSPADPVAPIVATQCVFQPRLALGQLGEEETRLRASVMSKILRLPGWYGRLTDALRTQRTEVFLDRFAAKFSYAAADAWLDALEVPEIAETVGKPGAYIRRHFNGYAGRPGSLGWARKTKWHAALLAGDLPRAIELFRINLRVKQAAKARAQWQKEADQERNGFTQILAENPDVRDALRGVTNAWSERPPAPDGKPVTGYGVREGGSAVGTPRGAVGLVPGLAAL